MTTTSRRCGECSACCTTHAVPEILKPEMQACKNLASNGGCGIYGIHPWACRHFRCLWLEGFGEDDERPDKSGIVLGWSVPASQEVATLHIVSVAGTEVPEQQAKEFMLRFQLYFGLETAQGLLVHSASRKELVQLAC